MVLLWHAHIYGFIDGYMHLYLVVPVQVSHLFTTQLRVEDLVVIERRPMEAFWKVAQYANANCLPIDKLAYIPVVSKI